VDPCENGGVCTTKDDQTVCGCPPEYEGDLCEKSVDDCAEEPCQNGGTCVDGAGSFTCTCAEGFSGLECERAVSGCGDEPCLNGSTCETKGSSYACTCKAGYSGTNCEVNVDECAAKPCKNGGTCTDAVDAYKCACKAGFTGTQCEINVDDCAAKPCQNAGTCTDGVNAFTCSCNSRYTGPTCQYLEVKLVPSDFQGGGWGSRATALSNDGNVLVFNGWKGDDKLAGRLVGFSSANLLVTGGSAFGIDADGGNVAGSWNTGSLDEAFKMVGAVATTLDLSSLGWGEAWTVGNDVSADGKVVVGTLSQGGGTGPFFCKTGQACKEVPVDATNWITKVASAVNGDGSIVVGTTIPADPTNGAYFAWRWVTTAAKAAPLVVPSAAWAYPRATSISRNGLVIVGAADINGVTHAVRWSGASLTAADLGEGEALGTNADGSVTVGTDGSAALVWLDTKRQTLASLVGSNPDLSGVTLKQAVAVSDDGKVVAATGSISGTDRALMVRLP
jgi:uncharacterized membrane protein